MASYSVDNKRIAKNAIFLYLRTFIVMIISLITSRVVLQALGIVDYGVYNVVGGIIILFSFLNSSMASATQRFLTFELGKNNSAGVNYYFNISILAHFTIGLLMVLVCETIGLWFMNTQLDIPADRVSAARIVYQFTILGGFFQILRIPFHAAIISFERMTFYAYVSIFEAILKLIVAYFVLRVNSDRLIVYSALMALVILVSNFVQVFYCLKNFPECKFVSKWDWAGYKELMSFSGWAMCSGVSSVAATQGLSFIFNIFRGVVLNAAMGIMNQVTMAVSMFFGSFQVAFTPQLIKSYSGADWPRFYSLLYKSSRLSYFLAILVAIPIIVFCEPLLNIWLVEVPDFAVPFSQVMIFYFVIDSLSCPLWTSIRATGDVRKHEIEISILSILNLPLAIIILKVGLSPVWAIAIKVFLNGVAWVVRVFLMKKQVGMNIRVYLKNVIKDVVFVTVLSFPIPLICKSLSTNRITDLLGLLISFISTALVVFFVGMTRTEREMIYDKVFHLLRIKPTNRI